MTLALIAGRGDLPAKVAAAQDQAPLICGYEGMLPDSVSADLTFRLETLGTLLVQLGERGITRVCFCGAIDRPALDPSKLDAETLPLVPLFQKALAAGDNGALQILMEIFEQTGFDVVGADELLPDLVAQQGVLSEKWPNAQMRKDAAKGEAVLAGLAPLDIGQACVIGREQVLGVETIGGTDHLLSTLPPEAKGADAILCKGPKEGQIREIDMPTIGPNTLTAAHAAGLAGVVVDAGDVIILDQDRCAALADELGLVLWVRRGGEGVKVFILAGEPSGDKLGGALMAGLKELRPDVQFDGIGGPEMMAQGLVSRFDMTELSVMGLAEILPKYRALMARINETAQAVIDTAPDVLITIDSPDFSLRVARRVKAKSSIRTVHYVAPSVWAWRPGRAEKMARWVDHVLALLPFEPPFMEAAGMACDFVGHPVVAEPVAQSDEIAAFRASMDLADAPLALILPGSRRSEVSRLLPIFQQVAARLVRARPDLRIVVPAAGPVASDVRRAMRTWEGRPIVLDPTEMELSAAQAQKRAAFAAADVAVAASGTVSLELAAATTPMVIAYDMNWLSRQIIGRMVKIDTVTLVNLVSETRAVPEFIGANCRPGPIAEAALKVLDDPQMQLDAMALTMQRLGQGGAAPGLRAAQAVLDRLP